MTPPFSVRTTPHFERLHRRLLGRNPQLTELLKEARRILQEDPYNRSRRYHIIKLEGVRPGEGQYRLRLGRFRIRYDISGQEVALHYIGLRREETNR